MSGRLLQALRWAPASRRVTTIAAALALLPGLSCGGSGEPIRIGVVMSESALPGVQIAAREINEAGGVRGRPLELVGDHSPLHPFQPEPERVLDVAHRLGRNPEVLAVIGHDDSASALSASAVYNQLELPQLVTIATHAAITNIGPWTYRLCISDARQGPALARYAVDDWGKRRIAIFYVNDEYGRDLARQFEEEARARGGVIVARILHRSTLEDSDRELLEREIEGLAGPQQPDLVVLFQRVEAADWTLQTLRDHGVTSDVLGADNLGRSAFLETLPELKEGVRVSQFFVPDRDDPRTRRFVAAHRRLTGERPDYGSAFAYDAVYLVRDALEHGGLGRRQVRAYLDRLIAEGRRIEGAAGAYTLMPDHDAQREISIVEIRSGAFQPLTTFLAGGPGQALRAAHPSNGG